MKWGGGGQTLGLGFFALRKGKVGGEEIVAVSVRRRRHEGEGTAGGQQHQTRPLKAAGDELC